MMSISDILQLIALCALIFIPLGYALCVGKRRMMKALRPLLFRPRFVKPAGTLRRRSTDKANVKHD